MIHSWVYSGAHLPRNEVPRVHLNFWCIEEPPSDLQEHEVVLAGFKYVPLVVPPSPEPKPKHPWWMFWRR